MQLCLDKVQTSSFSFNKSYICDVSYSPESKALNKLNLFVPHIHYVIIQDSFSGLEFFSSLFETSIDEFNSIIVISSVDWIHTKLHLEEADIAKYGTFANQSKLDFMDKFVFPLPIDGKKTFHNGMHSLTLKSLGSYEPFSKICYFSTDDKRMIFGGEPQIEISIEQDILSSKCILSMPFSGAFYKILDRIIDSKRFDKIILISPCVEKCLRIANVHYGYKEKFDSKSLPRQPYDFYRENNLLCFKTFGRELIQYGNSNSLICVTPSWLDYARKIFPAHVLTIPFKKINKEESSLFFDYQQKFNVCKLPKKSSINISLSKWNPHFGICVKRNFDDLILEMHTVKVFHSLSSIMEKIQRSNLFHFELENASLAMTIIHFTSFKCKLYFTNHLLTSIKAEVPQFLEEVLSVILDA